MQTLSNAQEQQVIGLLERMVDLSNQGSSPDDALHKVATSASLNPNFVRRLAEVYNTSRMLAHFKTAAAENRADTFPIADAGSVLKKMYPQENSKSAVKAAAVERSTWFNAPPNFNQAPMQKAAFAPVELKPTHGAVDIDMLMRKVANHSKALRRSIDSAQTDEHFCGMTVKESIDRAARYFSTLYHTPFDEVETNVLSKYGSTAKPLMNAIYAACRGEKFGKKRASVPDRQRIFDSESEPYNYIDTAVRQAREWLKAAAETRNLRQELASFESGIKARMAKFAEYKRPRVANILEGIEKRSIGLTGVASTAILGEKIGDLYSDEDDKGEYERRVQQAIDPRQEAELRAAKTQAMLNDFMTNDPVISGHDPETVLQAFNEISQMTPRVAEQPAMLRGLLARALELGRTEPFEAEQAISAETGLRRAGEPERL